MRAFLFVTLAFFQLNLSATNLVQNPGFETNTGLPTNEGQINQAVGWMNSCSGCTTFPDATPDYHHTGATAASGVQLPNTGFGTVAPRPSSNAVASFITYNFFVSDFREYIATQLSSSLTVGAEYRVSFWLANSSGNAFYEHGSDNLGIAFTQTLPSQSGHAVITGITPQVEITQPIFHTAWTLYSYTFIATAAHTFMTIGNFNNDTVTTVTPVTSSFPISMFFIDDIIVEEVPPLHISSMDLQIKEHDSFQAKFFFSAQGDFSSDLSFTLERSLDGVNFEDRSFAITTLSPGERSDFEDSFSLFQPYTYRVKAVDTNGEKSFSNTVRLESSFICVSVENVVNPVINDTLKFSLSGPANTLFTYTVFNLNGELLFETQVTKSHDGIETIIHDLSSDSLSSGVYLLQIRGVHQGKQKILFNGKIQYTRI